jgi:hypothetical protein
MELETEKIVLISEKKYRATVAADQARIGELLKDKSVRLQLKQIMPDLVKRVVLDLKGRRFTVSMINGATQTLKMR